MGVPKSPFSENLLRNILDLNPAQQLDLCKRLAKGKDSKGHKFGKADFKAEAEGYRALNALVGLAQSQLTAVIPGPFDQEQLLAYWTPIQQAAGGDKKSYEASVTQELKSVVANLPPSPDSGKSRDKAAARIGIRFEGVNQLVQSVFCALPIGNSERVAIGLAVEAELGNRQGRRTDLAGAGLPQNFAEVAGKETREIAAQKAGFGNPETYRQAKMVVQNASPELVEALDDGAIAVSTAARVVPRSVFRFVDSGAINRSGMMLILSASSFLALCRCFGATINALSLTSDSASSAISRSMSDSFSPRPLNSGAGVPGALRITLFARRAPVAGSRAGDGQRPCGH